MIGQDVVLECLFVVCCRLALTLADFELLRRIGEGSYSYVVLAKHKDTGKEYALKIIDKLHIIRHNAVEAVRRERALLDSLEDDGVVNLHFTFQDAASLYLGLEYCPGGELYDQILAKGSLDIDNVRFYAAEIVLILQALRKHRIVHRDLKPENLLLTSLGHLKIVDFGSAKQLTENPTSSDQKSKENVEGNEEILCRNITAATSTASSSPLSDVIRDNKFSDSLVNNSNRKEKELENDPTGAPSRTATLVGTADYVSPELLKNDEVGYSADLWSLGCVVYQMIVGKPPFKAASEYLTFQKIIERDFPPLPDSLPDELNDLVEKLLSLDPMRRIGAKDLEELKSHPFFAPINWDLIREQKAPDMVPIEEESLGSTGSSFDWELASLAAAIPKLASERGDNKIDLDEEK